MASLKVLIVGAGISGPALAFWLARIGCDITIIERSPNLRATGQQIDLTGQALVIMKMMGIEDAVRAALCPEPGMRFIDQQGKSIAFFGANNSGERPLGGTKEIEIMRGDLVRIMYDITKGLPQVKYDFGTHIQTITQDENLVGGKAHVSFSNGSQDNYDIIIGADGSSSVTRKIMLSPSHPDPCYDLGFHIAYFTAPSLPSDTNDWTCCHLPGSRIVMTRKDSSDNIRVYLFMRGQCAALDAAENLADRKEALLAVFKETDGAQLDRFLRDLRESPMSDDLYSQHGSRIRLPQGEWSRNRVVLTGDAAYSTSVGGVGSTGALVGAYVLAGELKKEWNASQQTLEKFNLQTAAKEYEHVVRPLIQGSQGLSPVLLKAMAPRTRLGIWILHMFVKAVVALRINKLFAILGSPVEAEKLQYLDYFGFFEKDKDRKEKS